MGEAIAALGLVGGMTQSAMAANQSQPIHHASILGPAGAGQLNSAPGYQEQQQGPVNLNSYLNYLQNSQNTQV